MNNTDTGVLLEKEDIELHREFFEEFVAMLGIQVIFKKSIINKQYDLYAELHDQVVQDGQLVGCIFEEHPSERTTRKLGWNSEKQDTPPIIHVPYGLDGLQKGSQFIIPSALDGATGRVFKVLEISSIAIYPCSVACLLGPVVASDFSEADLDHSDQDFTVLKDLDSEDPEEDTSPITLSNDSDEEED